MKRVLLMMAAAASVATAMAPATPAFARDGDRDRRAERQERGRGDRDGSDRGQPQRGRPDRGAQDSGTRRYEAQAPRRDDNDRRRYDDRPRDEDRRYEPAPRPNYMSPAPGVAARRGYAPDSYRGGGGGVVDDYRRYRLRPPPQGYDWVRMGSGFALVERGSGRVFDRVN